MTVESKYIVLSAWSQASQTQDNTKVVDPNQRPAAPNILVGAVPTKPLQSASLELVVWIGDDCGFPFILYKH